MPLSGYLMDIEDRTLVYQRDDGLMDEWMDDLRFYVLFNSISVISGRCEIDNGRLCAMELRLRLRRFRLEREPNSVR